MARCCRCLRRCRRGGQADPVQFHVTSNQGSVSARNELSSALLSDLSSSQAAERDGRGSPAGARIIQQNLEAENEHLLDGSVDSVASPAVLETPDQSSSCPQAEVDHSTNASARLSEAVPTDVDVVREDALEAVGTNGSVGSLASPAVLETPDQSSSCPQAEFDHSEDSSPSRSKAVTTEAENVAKPDAGEAGNVAEQDDPGACGASGPCNFEDFQTTSKSSSSKSKTSAAHCDSASSFESAQPAGVLTETHAVTSSMDDSCGNSLETSTAVMAHSVDAGADAITADISDGAAVSAIETCNTESGTEVTLNDSIQTETTATTAADHGHSQQAKRLENEPQANELRLGARVRVEGTRLEDRNGTLGDLLNFNPAEKRWTVKFDDGQELQFRPECLIVEAFDRNDLEETAPAPEETKPDGHDHVRFASVAEEIDGPASDKTETTKAELDGQEITNENESLGDEADEAAKSGELEDESPLAKVSESYWHVNQAFGLCSVGEEETFKDKAGVDYLENYNSVRTAVDELNADETMSQQGIAVVFSERVGSYFLLHKSDNKEEAFGLFGLPLDSPPTRLIEHTESQLPRVSTASRSSWLSTCNGKSVMFGKLQDFVKNHFSEPEQKFDFSSLKVARCMALSDKYEIIRELGAGAQGTTYKVTRKHDGAEYVAKEQKPSSTDGVQAFRAEFEKMRDFRHPNCLKVIELLENPLDKSLFIISELARGGDLYKYMKVMVKREGSVSEDNVSQVFFQAMAGVAFLHSNNCVHNDLKPDNILVMDKYKHGQTPTVVIGDYGCATLRCTSKNPKIIFGDPRFQAPESLRELMKYSKNRGLKLKPNNPKHDVWSMGVTLYEILSGGIFPFVYKRCPSVFKSFDDEHWVTLRTNLLNSSEVEVNEHMDTDVSKNADSILRLLLTKDADERPSAQSSMRHPWFSAKEGQKLSTKCTANLCFTASSNKARQVILNGLAADLQNKHRKKCFRIFQQFDRDDSGTIDKDEFKEAFKAMGFDAVQADEIFERVDVDGTGTLEFNEFVAMTYDWRSVDQEHLDKLLTEFLSSVGVTDNGETISKEGLETLFSGILPPEELEYMLKQNVRDIGRFVRASTFYGPDGTDAATGGGDDRSWFRRR